MNQRARQERLQALGRDWDVIVVGGGITGAGIFRLAGQQGLRCLLLEQRDFAWGTSSRSGKLVHGGLRYIAQGQLRTSLHSVRERERLLRGYPGLVEPLTFVIADPPGGLPIRLGLGMLLALYDRMARRHSRRRLDGTALRQLAPGLTSGPRGGFSYVDGTTDDARLVLRVIGEGQALGGEALNDLRATDLVRGPRGRVQGVVCRDELSGESVEVGARVVINAAGVWADELRQRLGHPPRLRRLRGSHLIFPRHRLPLPHAVGLISPIDGRNMYVLPWEGVTLLGTTDIDHEPGLDQEPRIARREGSYLLETIHHWFPEARLTEADVLATTAGVRPVLDTGKADPSKESREEAVWTDDGLVTISGGKLTTFPLMARRALSAARSFLDGPAVGDGAPSREGESGPVGTELPQRLVGRYGEAAAEVVELDRSGELEPVGDTAFTWAELRYAARAEQVAHLEDLLLRRTRLGLLLPEGGAALLDRVQQEVADELSWGEARWAREREDYLEQWQRTYSPALIQE